MIKKLLNFLLLFTLFVNTSLAFAAGDKVYLTGPKDSVAPQSIVSLDILLDASQPTNALDIAIAYPPDKLTFQAFDNTGSIIDIWQTKPAVGNTGKIAFSGGMIKPFQGTHGLLGKVSFKILGGSGAKVDFTKEDIYLADGKGTKLSVSGIPFTLSVKESAPVVTEPVVPFQNTPADVIIQKELETFKTNIFWTTTLPGIILIIIFVFGAIVVYNKLKRKANK